MVFRLNSNIRKLLLVWMFLPVTGYTATVNKIVAIVNDHAITASELDQRISALKASQQPYGTKMQVLNHLIDENLLLQKAQDMGVKVTQDQVLQQVQTVAQQNHLSIEQLQQAVQQQGISWSDYLSNIYQQMVVQAFQQGFVQQHVVVTQNDVAAFLRQYPTGIKPLKQFVNENMFIPKAVDLQQIFLPLPTHPSESDIAMMKRKIQQIYADLSQGRSFAQVAQQYSAGPTAKQGGELGLRLNEQWPELFMNAIKGIPDGGVSQPIAAPNGVHILRVVERRGVNEVRRRMVTEPEVPYLKLLKANKPVIIPEYNVQIIRVSMTPVVTTAMAKAKINHVYELLQKGGDFAQLAKQYSDDPSAPIGGALGWVNQGTQPAMVINLLGNLADHQFGKPILLGSDYFIFLRNAKRTKDISTQLRQNYAFQSLFDEHAKAVIHDFNTQLRAGAYIKNYLTE